MIDILIFVIRHEHSSDRSPFLDPLSNATRSDRVLLWPCARVIRSITAAVAGASVDAALRLVLENGVDGKTASRLELTADLGLPDHVGRIVQRSMLNEEDAEQ